MVQGRRGAAPSGPARIGPAPWTCQRHRHARLDALCATADRRRALNRLGPGFFPLFRAVAALDGDVIALIIAAGTDTRGKPVGDLTHAVYEAGLEDLVDPVTHFLTLCCNGGRDPAAVKAKPVADGGDRSGDTHSEVAEPTDDEPGKSIADEISATSQENAASRLNRPGSLGG